MQTLPLDTLLPVMARAYLTTLLLALLGYTLAELASTRLAEKTLSLVAARMPRSLVHPRLAPALPLFALSPTAAHAYASKLLRTGEVEAKDVILLLLAAEPLIRVYYLVRLYLPLLTPLLGATALYYVALRLPLDAAYLAAALVLGRRTYANTTTIEQAREHGRVRAGKEAVSVRGILARSLKAFRGFAARYTIAYTATLALLALGAQEHLAQALAALTGGLDRTLIAYTTTALLSPTTAYGLAATLKHAGYPETRILAYMMLGAATYILANEWWRRALPLYTSMYPRNLVPAILALRYLLPGLYLLALGLALYTQA